MRYLAAQMSAYLKDGLWLDLARRANASAQELSRAIIAKGGELAHPVDGNEVFIHLPEGMAARLSSAGAGFYPWMDGSHRFVCSWATTPDDIAALTATIA
jgi:threonine aldolase